MIAVRRPLALLASSLLALAAGCNTGFAPQYRVTDLRVLAVRSQVVGMATHAADADLGDTVRLTALVANPLARQPLQIRWRACAPSATELLSPCLDPQWLATPERFDTPEAANLGVFALEEVPGATLAPDGTWIEVPLTDPGVQAIIQQAFDQAIQFAIDNPPYRCTLYVELPVVVIVEAGGLQQVSVKRVRLTPKSQIQSNQDLAGKYILNVNPGITGLYFDPSDQDSCVGGAPLAVTCDALSCDTAETCEPDPQGGLPVCAPLPGGLDATPRVLCGRIDDRFTQEFNQCSPSGTPVAFDERTTWQWYTTGGSLSDADGVGNATSAHPKLTRPQEAFTLWLLLRDGRGGEAWLRRDFAALP